ncbi:MAG TPA: Hsp20/alpha crystallin family protein [bacterium]|nr:Hsp20/alpha crystallin family protein [bacterium]
MLSRWTPFEELFALQRDLMNLFDRVFSQTTMPAPTRFTPAMEAYYREGHLVVRAELAGVDPKSVDVSFARNTLTIKGQRTAPEVPADDRVFGEIPYGTFERTINLPEGLDPEHIKARWHEGILEISIPVAKALQPRKVPIEVVRA